MNKKSLNQLTNAIYQFNLTGTPSGCVQYGNGHINDTFLVTSYNGENKQVRYILQAINHTIFKDPESLMNNIEMVTSFLSTKASDKREVMTLIKTKDNKSYYNDKDGFYWRMYDFIEDSVCLELPENNEDFYQCAVAFGNFQRLLAEFPAEKLTETIPDFHNTPKRYNDFLNAVKADSCGRASGVKNEIKFIMDRKDFYSTLIDSNKKGLLPLRVSHNDTKSNNVMLDEKTHKALCVIDLDTIMPGFSVTDFGDSIRFGASTAAEDEKNLDKVQLDIGKFKAYTEGFLDGCGGMLGNDEIMLLPEGAKMMTIECGMRFLTDYLSGDTYFKTAYADHNLVRCHTQLKLVSEMEAHWDELKQIVKHYCK